MFTYLGYEQLLVLVRHTMDLGQLVHEVNQLVLYESRCTSVWVIDRAALIILREQAFLLWEWLKIWR